jgi:yecA family protein
MYTDTGSIMLPSYMAFTASISALALPISASELHGVMCGYLAAGSMKQGEAYVRALVLKRDEHATRTITMALFELFTISQHQMAQMGFDFQLLLPDDDSSLETRAQAFSEWCEGFIQGLRASQVDYTRLDDDDIEDAVLHLSEFARLDYSALAIGEEDEKALMEVIEYARMAVLHIYTGVKKTHLTDEGGSLPN